MVGKKPIGIIIMSVFDIIIGVILLVPMSYGFLYFVRCFVNFGSQPECLGFTSGYVFGLIISIILIMSGIWMLKLKNKGRKINICLFSIFAIYFGLVAIPPIDISYLIPIGIFIGFSIFIIWYLTRPKVKALFTAAKPDKANA